MSSQFIGAMTRALGMRGNKAIESEGRDPEESFHVIFTLPFSSPFPFSPINLSPSFLLLLRHSMGKGARVLIPSSATPLFGRAK